ncbi:MAG TPA: hypothetical protein VMT34_06325 [Aggregatilineales bacterium]|nr:hypothetical protein [Aggregatilineales bacterium]
MFVLILLGVFSACAAAPQAPTADPTQCRLRVLIYRPDGSLVTLPVTIHSGSPGGDRIFQSGSRVAFPAGTYDLTIDLPAPYTAKGITLPAGAQLDLPITLAEAQFITKDRSGALAPFKGFLVRGASTTQEIAADAPVLLGPGTVNLTLAPIDQPDATQPVNLTLLPGEHQEVPIRADLFGAGILHTSVTDTDGNPVSVWVKVYQKDGEDGPPILVFKSEDGPQSVPEGEFVVSVLTKIAWRQPITVARKQTIPITVKLGTITINARDPNDLPIAPMIYVVADSEIQRLQKPIDETFNLASTYGLYVSIARNGTSFVVPQGSYSIMIEGASSSLQDVSVGDTPVNVTLKSK